MLDRLITSEGTMSYHYSFDLMNRIIYVKICGVINETNAAELGAFLRTKALDMNFKLFFDLSESENKISMGSAYFWFGNQYSKIDPKVRYIPCAYYINIAENVFYSFLQTVCMNQGIKIRVFSVEQDALSWLKSQYI